MLCGTKVRNIMSRLFQYVPPLLRYDLASIGASRTLSAEAQPAEQNPFLKKYADKIAALQNSSPEEYNARIEKLNAAVHLKDSEKPEVVPNSSKPTKQHHSLYENKTLDEVMKLELLQNKSREEIEKIWKEYHKEKEGLFAVLPSEAYKKMFSNFQSYPTFVFPLPKDEGYEFIMSQFSGNSCHFTPLIKFQTFKENAPTCLTLTYFNELQDTKGIVLMRGEYDDNVIKVLEAHCLTNQLQLFYGGDNQKKISLLQHFTNQPDTFQHMDLIRELELGLSNP